MATIAGKAYCSSSFPTGWVPNCSVASLLSMMQKYKNNFKPTLFNKEKSKENVADFIVVSLCLAVV